ncbi:UDP-N-acetylmuramoylalanyl-D-glutamyl-2,6-diaminopimelate--D-alanyl-D-alanine ligase [Microvirga arsenatis]|uniref:UDP-N-acetylmuramoyl-tripeptide--D-alanyl-D-alanine ligase n=1 Tax=Microvirga arsenatis TaxID=2692265 RepID=A0ABW9Z022_9HYPH|nr:UDP-N-acetylmuramoylalanyl-D-glutamyl-2,6-diaminopimelate--D-alanyl-D-alanine ligase [Microvirga arsenatis]NBJ11907.1 UDP-N-acetylmuramoylalanyl-D-glutamyl-2,6-diaminopimelate--D-alanyl-D-alanine ligase [Microvirga arsenatis]NBJ24019.1 UDP-N-acetylmuramoylalanyl-D-glutamyl-2,6-diaminopimelate--D-alanyl-D-alanine ligase [Microvirga arsenatis]
MNSPLWTRDEIAAATGARVGGGFGQATGASIDTRTLEPGDLYFAIRGDVHDGHDFVPAALEKGASAAVVSEEKAPAFSGSDRLIVVPDVLEAMRQMGRAARARTGARIVAVTGSVGKTGTKEAMRLALSGQGATHASVASYNNHWGVPLTLARMPRETAFGVFEIGMNHAYEILPLTSMVRPHVAVITTVEPVHIEFFPSLWGIADAKGEIFAGLEPGGTAVINRDNAYFERMRAHALASAAGRVVTFGEHEAADIRARQIVVKPDHSMVDATIFGEPLTYRIGTAGRHHALNSLSVLAASHALGADVALVALSFAELKPPVGRGERTILSVDGGEALLIDESYNANPASMRAALANLGAVELARGARRIAVLGDMKELGEKGPGLHSELAEAIQSSGTDLVFAAGPLMRHLVDALPKAVVAAHAESSAELVDAVCAAVRPGDAVTVKGSLSMKMALVVKALKERYGASPAAHALKG